MGKKYSDSDIKSWPKNYKRCKKCQEVKNISNFTKDSKALFSVSNYCRKCINKTNRSWSNFTKEEINSWPKNHKKCSSCNEIKSFSEFNKTRHQIFGLGGKCKQCISDIRKINWDKNIKNNVKTSLFKRTKYRATRDKILFNLSEEDIIIPDRCPVLGTEFVYGDYQLTYSIDRIIPELGYTKGNIIIVSNKANMIKNNATPDEILAVGNFYKELMG